MAFPALFVSVGAGVAAGLTSFFATRAGAMLAGLGLTIIGVKSFEAFLGYVISDINMLSSMVGSVDTGGGGAAVGIFLQVAAFCGLFDALNIIISGYMAAASLIGMKIVFGRLSK